MKVFKNDFLKLVIREPGNSQITPVVPALGELRREGLEWVQGQPEQTLCSSHILPAMHAGTAWGGMICWIKWVWHLKWELHKQTNTLKNWLQVTALLCLHLLLEVFKWDPWYDSTYYTEHFKHKFTQPCSALASTSYPSPIKQAWLSLTSSHSSGDFRVQPCFFHVIIGPAGLCACVF